MIASDEYNAVRMEDLLPVISVCECSFSVRL